ncbi:hypothetical protein MNBD_ALPHA07-941 [hydrothermal vent metagenome]|uniref:Uncharacterized protein n=1 Tax=hydrothermal vent metagenome TaxID=652676 RepID=A0A3B0R4N2_9ZZZZ
MANADNHSYPPTGFTRSSREMPGASFEEMRNDALKGEVEQEELVGLIRGVMHDPTGPTKDKPRSEGKSAAFFGKSAVSRQHVMPKSKAKPTGRGVFRKVLSYLGRALWRMLKPGLARLKAYRPTRKHIGFAVLALVVFFRPWLIPITILTLVVIAVIAWLSLGPDRVTEFIYGLWLRLRARNPEQAEKIRSRFQAGVTRINKISDWMPGKWAERARLPDFSDDNQQAPSPDRVDPFDRLADETRQQQAGK